MKVLVTGTEGYIGAVLAPLLMREGHDVTGLDTCFYRNAHLYHSGDSVPKTLVKDIRQITADDLRGFDAVVHMAELSNDPAGQLAPHITYEINHKGSLHLATLAKAAGVRRFVYTSSCSVYGVATEPVVSETSKVNPQTAYAICKTLVERDLAPLASDGFSPVFLRNATAYGASPRMRFDIVLNNLSGLAWTTGEIKMTSDGTPWRPLVHVLDICKAVSCCLSAPREAIHNEVFNVGDTSNNYQVREIAQFVAEVFTGCKLTFGKSDSDNRSYRVNFDKINSRLPGFRCDWNARKGAEQLHRIFKQIEMTADVFQYRGFTRLKQLEHLMRTHQIDANFLWAV